MNDGIFLSLGTNMGNRALNLALAAQALATLGEIRQKSSVYRTAAWGKTDQASFYNQVLEMRTSLNPEDLLDKILSIEQQLGRVRDERWGPRIIDIDLLFYNDKILQQHNLNIPHPGIASRRFVLEPFAEINTAFIHPVLHKSVGDLLAECTDQLAVEKVTE